MGLIAVSSVRDSRPVSDRFCRISRLPALETPSPSRTPAEKSRSIAQPVKRAKFSRDSASANAAGRPGAPWAFTLSHDLKEIHLLWIMPRFPVRWRASRIQYLRPLSSYSWLGAKAALGNERIVIVIEARGLSPSSSSSSPILLLFRGAGCGAYNISDSHSAHTYPRTCTPRHVARTRVTTRLRLSVVWILSSGRGPYSPRVLLAFLLRIVRRLLYVNSRDYQLKSYVLARIYKSRSLDLRAITRLCQISVERLTISRDVL